MFSNGEIEECVLSIGVEDWDLIGNHPNELKVLLFAPGSPTIGGSAPPANIPVPEAALKCPRCESTNIKSCYYSNYVLSQPRNFCKMCRRYWTQGVALRYVPAGGIWRQNRRSNSPESRDNQTNSGPTATISSTICAAKMLDSFMSPLSQITDNFPTYAGFQQQMNLNLKGEGVDDQGSTSYGGFDYHQPTSSTHHGSDAQGSTSYGGFQPPMNLNSTHHGPDAEPSTSRGGFNQQRLTEPLYVIDIGIPDQILHQQWKDYIVIKKKIPVGSRELSDPVIHIVTQVASAALSYSIGGSSGTKHTVFATSLVGFGFTFAGIGMRSANPKLASVATKIGAVTSASAVIVGLAATLPAILAWPAGIVAGMGVLVAVTFS